MSKFCHSCHFYQAQIFTRAGSSFGICTNNETALRISADTSEKNMLEEDGIIYTEEYFGCINWRDNNGTLIDLGDIIDQKTGKIKKDENDKSK